MIDFLRFIIEVACKFYMGKKSHSVRTAPITACSSLKGIGQGLTRVEMRNCSPVNSVVSL